MRPLAVDLFCGLGGWAEGLLAEGYDVIGFDVERHQYGDYRYPAQLVIQDVATLHGSQFKEATLIVASPPCQEYSYMAMPWKLAKAKAAAIRSDSSGKALADLNRLFDSCFRIQKEATVAAGRRIPMVVENVRGAIPWVGRSRWNFGSFHLWGDVPALMPVTFKAAKVPGFRFSGSGKSFQSASVEHTGVKAPGMNWSDQSKRGQDFTRWFAEARKGGVGGTFASFGSKSPERKMASAMIAKIPEPLSRHIAATFRNRELAEA
jgi:C-5 cytosine-specific DNA methylase